MEEIRFKLSSEFAGEGFTKVNSAVSSTARGVKSAIQPFNQLSNSLGVFDTKAAKTAQSVTNVVGAFAAMGPLGGIIATVQTGISIAFAKIKADADALVQSAIKNGNTIKEKMNSLIDRELDGVKTKLTEVGAKADADAKSFDVMTAAAKKVAAAVGESESTAGAAEIANLELEKLNAVIKQQNENMTDLVSAEYDLKIATTKLTNTKDDHKRSLDTFKKDETTANTKFITAQNNLTAAKDALARAENTLRTLEDAGVRDTQKLNAAKAMVEQAEKNLEARELQLVTASGDLEVAHKKVETEENKMEAAIAARTGELEKAKKALEDVKKKQEAEAEALKKKTELENEIKENEQEREKLAQNRENAEQTRESERDLLIQRMKEAQEKSEEWEKESEKLREKHYTDIQKKNLEMLAKRGELGEKSITQTQREQVDAYKRWLEAHAENPWEQVKMDLQAKFETLDSATKESIRCTEISIRSVDENIQSLREQLVDCMKIK